MTQQSESQALLPCPFCGKRPETYSSITKQEGINASGEYHSIGIKKCGIHCVRGGIVSAWGHTPEHAMNKLCEDWNTRASDIDGLIAEIRAKYLSADEYDEIVECGSIEEIIRKHFGKE